MFGFLKKGKPQKPQQAAELFALSDEGLADLIRKTFESQDKVVGALFLVAYENLPVYFSVFSRAAEEEKEFDNSMEGMAVFLDSTRRKYSGTSISDETNSRRFFYLYLAALLKVLHARAKARPELWDAVAAIWVQLLPGAHALRETLDRTNLWTPDEVVLFQDIKTGMEGENFCLSFMAPSEIRYHQTIRDWQEKDLSPEIIAELRATERLLRGE